MQYSVIMYLDQNNQPDRFFGIYTKFDPIVFVFQSMTKLEAFLTAVVSTLPLEEGQKIGTVSFEAKSIYQAVRGLLEIDPSLTGAANFVPDSDPLYDIIMAEFGSERKN
jgi:hypothetical protein